MTVAPQAGSWFGAIVPMAMIGASSYGTKSGGMYDDLAMPSHVFAPLLANLLFQFGIAALFVRRYRGRLAAARPGRDARRRAGRAVWFRWTPRPRSRGAALAWLTVRQAVPMCLPGLLLACLIGIMGIDMHQVDISEAMERFEARDADLAEGFVVEEPLEGAAVADVSTTLPTEVEPAAAPDAESSDAAPAADEAVAAGARALAAEPGDEDGVPMKMLVPLVRVEGGAGEWPGPPARHHRLWHVWQAYKDGLPSSMWFVGIGWAVVVGAGMFSAEIDRRVGEFWRTRPIASGQLFAIKFVVGMAVVLAVLDGSVVLAGWGSREWGNYSAMNWGYLACIVPLHATLFAVAVAWACLLRRTALGGIAAFASFVLFGLVQGSFPRLHDFDPIRVYNDFGFRDRPHGGAAAANYPVVLAAMIVISIVALVIGWRALRRYDPGRQAG
ncbi:MAG TPA: hypothetical protein VMF30_00410, partial [Pirellulales bacterium]|nr:hypothetical protein [Pirellulales bacterium]